MIVDTNSGHADQNNLSPRPALDVRSTSDENTSEVELWGQTEKKAGSGENQTQLTGADWGNSERDKQAKQYAEEIEIEIGAEDTSGQFEELADDIGLPPIGKEVIEKAIREVVNRKIESLGTEVDEEMEDAIANVLASTLRQEHLKTE